MAAAACVRPSAVAPVGAYVPSSQLEMASSAAAAAPAGYQVARFSWRFDDGRLQVSGQGAARLAAPDTLRADIAAVLGLGRATVVMAGEQVQARPRELVERLLPDRFAMWAILGFLRAPAEPVRVERNESGDRVVWRTTDGAGRRTLFEVVGGRLVGVTRELDGRTSSQLALTRHPVTGEVVRARLTDFDRGARLEIEITGREPSGAFPPETWRLDP